MKYQTEPSEWKHVIIFYHFITHVIYLILYYSFNILLFITLLFITLFI